MSERPQLVEITRGKGTARSLLPLSAMRLLLAVAGLLLCGCRPALVVPEVAAAPCPETGAVVVVDTRARALWLCSDGRARERVRVALGRGGVDKRREGDRRTPLGSYALGEPRPSQGYGTFIPIGYPTAAQRARGLTGSHVGIHGPARRLSWLGTASTWIDWTAGCVATGSDEELARVAAFVRERRPAISLR